MKLRCRVAFGNFVPGDEVDVEDGAVFDVTYFEADSAETDIAEVANYNPAPAGEGDVA